VTNREVNVMLIVLTTLIGGTIFVLIMLLP
jgi:hypothetical protein